MTDPGVDVLVQSNPDPDSDIVPASIAPGRRTPPCVGRGDAPMRPGTFSTSAPAIADPAGEVVWSGPVLAPSPFDHRASAGDQAPANRGRLGRLLGRRSWRLPPIGEMPTFDATVAGTHNFVANGVIAHNSLEQDADVVLFLYRDEMYNPESADRGSAEVIVAKHRNGPTGKCQLAFLDHYTRFANMARV